MRFAAVCPSWVVYERTLKGKANAVEERKPKDTEEQFIYKARKKALGAFKRDLFGNHV